MFQQHERIYIGWLYWMVYIWVYRSYGEVVVDGNGV